MAQTKRILIITSCLLLGISAVGCSTEEPVNPTVATDEAAIEMNPVNRVSPPDPSLAGRYVTGGVIGYTSNDYTFDLTYTFNTGEASSSIANSAPGEAQIDWNWNGVFVATNTTAGRNSSWSYLSGISARALWPYDSVLCAEMGIQRNSVFGGAIEAEKAELDGSIYCSVEMGSLSSTNDIGIGETKWSDLSGQGSYTVSEASSAEILNQLSAGPAQIVLTGGANAPCNSNGAPNTFWSSNGSSSCIIPGGYVSAGTDEDLDISTALTVVDQYGSDAEPDKCPIEATPMALLPGLLGDSFQTWKWDRTGGVGPLSDDPFEYHGFDCADGAMMVELVNTSSLEDVNTFLANDHYASWPEISEDIPMYGGTLVVGTDSITPSSGDSYDIVRFAWTKDDLLVNGRLVSTTPEQTVDWVNIHLPQLLTVS